MSAGAARDIQCLDTGCCIDRLAALGDGRPPRTSLIAMDKNIGGEVDQGPIGSAYRLETLDLVGIKPPKSRSDWFSVTQRNQLYQDGIAGYRVLVDGT